MLSPPHIALLTVDKTQARTLEDLLRGYVVLTHAGRVSELPKLLQIGEFDALFCAQSLQDGTWMDALEAIRAHRLELPVIVLSRTGGEREWIEVIEAGAFDFLVPPFGMPQLLSVVEQAAASERAKRWQRSNRNEIQSLATAI